MEKIFYIVAACGFVVCLVVGLIVDHYRDKRREVIHYDSHGNEICSNVAVSLMVFCVIAFVMALCILDTIK